MDTRVVFLLHCVVNFCAVNLGEVSKAHPNCVQTALVFLGQFPRRIKPTSNHRQTASKAHRTTSKLHSICMQTASNYIKTTIVNCVEATSNTSTLHQIFKNFEVGHHFSNSEHNENPGLITFKHFQSYLRFQVLYLSFRWLQGCLVAELEPKLEPSPII